MSYEATQCSDFPDDFPTTTTQCSDFPDKLPYKEDEDTETTLSQSSAEHPSVLKRAVSHIGCQQPAVQQPAVHPGSLATNRSAASSTAGSSTVFASCPF